MELFVRLGVSSGRRDHGLPLFGDRIRLPQHERAAHQARDSGGPPALALQDKVAGSWLSSAKSGNPGLGFKPWTPAEPNAMLFDAVSEFKPLRDDLLITLMGNTGGRSRGTA